MFDAYTSLSMFLITKIILNRDKKEQLSITDTRICVNVFIWIKEREIFLLRHNFYNILNHRKKDTRLIFKANNCKPYVSRLYKSKNDNQILVEH